MGSYSLNSDLFGGPFHKGSVLPWDLQRDPT